MKPSWCIRPYKAADSVALFVMMEKEADWDDYCLGDGREKYQLALQTSLTYVLLENDTLCGYVRCREDAGFGIYVYDLLVDINSRGKNYGRYLMERVSEDFPEQTIYILSDVDPYYEKQGYQKEGSVFSMRAQ